MADKLLRRIVAKGKERRAGKQSDAYRWLYPRHASLAVALATSPPEWRVIAEEMTADGIKGGRSKPLTDRAVKRIWHRVCRDIAAEAVHRSTGVRPSASSRSKAPATWRPEQLPPPPQAPREPGPLPAQPSPSLGGSNPIPTQSPAGDRAGLSIGKSRLADIRQALNERSGR
jgi:hypothetical protein